MLLLIVLLPSVALSQATVTGNFSISGNFDIGTNTVDQGIQSMKAPGSLIQGGGLVAAWLVPRGVTQGDTVDHAGTVFDLSGNNFNLTSVVNGQTNQLAYGTAGTNQIGLVGVPSMNCSSNASLGLSRLVNINGVAPLFNVDLTGVPTNGGMTLVMLTRGRMIGTTSAGGLANHNGLNGGNANQIQFYSYQASPTQTKINFSSATNSATTTGGLTGATTNRWQFELVSWDGVTLNRMNNLANSSSTALSFGTNFTFTDFSVGLRQSSTLGNRFNGDWAGAMCFTNAMNDGTSRTNLLNWLNNLYHFY